MNEEELLIKLTQTEARSKRNEGRIKELEADGPTLNRMATAVEGLANEQRHQTEELSKLKHTVADLGNKVDALERKPAKRWDAVVEKIVLAVAAAMVSFWLARLGMG